MILRRNKGQIFLEYALLIFVIALAFVGIQSYVTRGVQGNVKESTDSIGEQFHAGEFKAHWDTSTTATGTEDKVGIDQSGNPAPGLSYTKFTNPETTTRNGYDKVESKLSDYGK